MIIIFVSEVLPRLISAHDRIALNVGAIFGGSTSVCSQYKRVLTIISAR